MPTNVAEVCRQPVRTAQRGFACGCGFCGSDFFGSAFCGSGFFGSGFFDSGCFGSAFFGSGCFGSTCFGSGFACVPGAAGFDGGCIRGFVGSTFGLACCCWIGFGVGVAVGSGFFGVGVRVAVGSGFFGVGVRVAVASGFFGVGVRVAVGSAFFGAGVAVEVATGCFGSVFPAGWTTEGCVRTLVGVLRGVDRTCTGGTITFGGSVFRGVDVGRIFVGSAFGVDVGVGDGTGDGVGFRVGFAWGTVAPGTVTGPGAAAWGAVGRAAWLGVADDVGVGSSRPPDGMVCAFPEETFGWPTLFADPVAPTGSGMAGGFGRAVPGST